MKKCKYCEGKYYAKGYCYRCYMRKRRGIPLDATFTYDVKPCKTCGKKEHAAKGLCKSCYLKEYREKNKRTKDKSEKKAWKTEDLEYLCQFHEVNSIDFIALGLGRTSESVMSKLQKLRAQSMVDHYKKSYERKLNE